ncbi:MAG: hypothetical protein JSR61_17845 [Proteobacteria bacterium]|nr:hypothetical protein [Pseudomonadota bacterium]
MKFAIPVVALLLAAGTAAQAKLTPFDGARESNAPVASANVTSNETSTASTAEQDYFRAPQAGESARPGRCSVSTFVFTKIRLAQACY